MESAWKGVILVSLFSSIVTLFETLLLAWNTALSL